MEPIESAPKDGTHIMLYGIIECDTGIVNDLETDSICTKVFFEGYYWESHGWYHVGLYPAYPTYWCELPTLP